MHAEATRVERSAGRWRICHGQACTVEADELVLTCPAYVAASLLDREAPSLARELDAIPYASAILVTLVYDRTEIEHPLDGFGFLVPRAERRTIAAATWVSTKFPSRIRPDLAAVRAFVVGRKAQELLSAPESALIELASADLVKFMGINATPRLSTVYRWPHSMPQYVVGHGARCRAIQASLREQRRLYLVGNAYDGVGIPDCVRLAKETAKQIAG
jgi:oxygen-dependent protoporphyrinogen oxidase